MKYKYLSTIIICVMVLMISIGSILTPDQEISLIEARNLEILPLPTFIREMLNYNMINVQENLISTNTEEVRNAELIEELDEDELENNNQNVAIQTDTGIKPYVDGILNGDYFTRWDKYFSDHLLGRNVFVNLYSSIQKNLKKEYINGVYFGEDGYLFTLPEYKPLTDNEIQKRADFFNQISEKYKDSQVYAVNLPNKYIVYENKIPIENYKSPVKGEFSRLIQNFSNHIKIIDLENLLQDSHSYFFKTDHHWNMEGTYQGYIKIIEEINKQFPEIPEAYKRDEFQVEEYKECFVGSDGRKVGSLIQESEDITVWNHDLFNKILVEINNQESQFYHYSNIKEGYNSYTVYMNGDNPIEIITNPEVNNDLSLVLIGDSMSNSLIPLLSLHFKTIYSYDMRYYQENLYADLNALNPDIIMLISLTQDFLNEDSKIFNFE